MEATSDDCNASGIPDECESQICCDGTCDPGENPCNCPQDCGSPAGSEVPGVTCQDGGDNDCDGQTDCADADCVADMACSCGNGTCVSGENPCNCPQDCGAPPADETPGATCQDGLDNDCDGQTVCADSGCGCDLSCSCGDASCTDGETSCNCPQDCGQPLVHETFCRDGVDNDCDGLTDCDDSECASFLFCTCGDGACSSPENQCTCPEDCGQPLATETVCNDGVDNDCDGFADCEDCNDTDCVTAEACAQACCEADGSCSEKSPFCCEAYHGSPQGLGSECATVECDAPQACCDIFGGCLDMPPSACVLESGDPQGPGTECATTQCLPAGACCLPEGVCYDFISVTQCAQMGGTSQTPGTVCLGDDDGDGIDELCATTPPCGNGTCNPPTEDPCNCPQDCGAPSASEMDCDDQLDNDCDGLTDTADPDCAGVGACCGVPDTPPYNCVDDTNESTCTMTHRGTFLGLGTTCSDADGDGAADGCDECPNTVPGSPVDGQGCPPAIPGDFDRDGDVDALDVGEFVACGSGPAIIPIAPGCEGKRLDGDNDIDQEDFAVLQWCYSGENNPGDPNCAN